MSNAVKIVILFAFLLLVVFIIYELTIYRKNYNDMIKLYNQVVSENEENLRLMFYSEYYSKVASVIWGSEARRCDIGLIKKIQEVINEVGDSSVTVDLVLAVMAVESGFNANAKSKAGAIGIMQIMPSTAKMHDKSVSPENLYNEYVNIKIGVKELSRLMKVFNGDMELVLLAYNRGQGRVLSLSGTESLRNSYPEKVFKYKIYFR